MLKEIALSIAIIGASLSCLNMPNDTAYHETVHVTITAYDKDHNGLYATNADDPTDNLIYIPVDLKNNMLIGDKATVSYTNDDVTEVIHYK